MWLLCDYDQKAHAPRQQTIPDEATDHQARGLNSAVHHGYNLIHIIVIALFVAILHQTFWDNLPNEFEVKDSKAITGHIWLTISTA